MQVTQHLPASVVQLQVQSFTSPSQAACSGKQYVIYMGMSVHVYMYNIGGGGGGGQSLYYYFINRKIIFYINLSLNVLTKNMASCPCKTFLKSRKNTMQHRRTI